MVYVPEIILLNIYPININANVTVICQGERIISPYISMYIVIITTPAPLICKIPPPHPPSKTRKKYLAWHKNIQITIKLLDMTKILKFVQNYLIQHNSIDSTQKNLIWPKTHDMTQNNWFDKKHSKIFDSTQNTWLLKKLIWPKQLYSKPKNISYIWLY